MVLINDQSFLPGKIRGFFSANTFRTSVFRDSVLFLIYVVFALSFFSREYFPDFGHSSDDGLYLILGKSFAEGTGYTDLSLPGRPATFTAPSVFPLALSLYWRFLHPHVLALQFAMYALMVAGGWMGFLWLRPRMGRMHAYLTTLAFTAMEMFVMSANGQRTECLFIPLLYLGLYLSLEGKGRPWRHWVAGICWVMLSRTRVVGVPFLLVFLWQCFMKKDWKKLVVIAALFCGWLLFEQWSQPSTAEGGYLFYATRAMAEKKDHLSEIRSVLDRVVHNGWSFAGSMYADLLFKSFYALAPMNFLKRLLVLSIFCWGCLGVFLIWKNRPELRPWLLALIVSWVPLWNWGRTGTLYRYLFPFFPMFVFFMVFPFIHYWEKYHNRFLKILAFCVTLSVAGNQIHHTLRHGASDPFNRDPAGFKQVHEQLASLKDQPDLIFSFQGRYAYLKTNIPSLTVRNSADIRKYSHFGLNHKCVLVAARDQFLNGDIVKGDSLNAHLEGPSLFQSGIWEVRPIRIVPRIPGLDGLPNR